MAVGVDLNAEHPAVAGGTGRSLSRANSAEWTPAPCCLIEQLLITRPTPQQITSQVYFTEFGGRC